MIRRRATGTRSPALCGRGPAAARASLATLVGSIAALLSVGVAFAEPIPRLEVDPPTEIHPNRPFRLTVRGVNQGSTARNGSLTISFPDNPPIRIVESSLPGGTRVYEPGEQMYHFGLRQPVSIQHRTVELFAQPWPASQTHMVAVEVVAPAAIVARARVTLAGAEFVTAPGQGPLDQQGAPSRAIELIPAVPPTAAPPTRRPARPTGAQPTAAPTPVPPTPAPPTAAPTSLAAPPPTATIPPTPAPTTAAPTSLAAALPTATVAPTAPPSPPLAAARAETVSMPLLVVGLLATGAGLALGLAAFAMMARRRAEPASPSPPSGSHGPPHGWSMHDLPPTRPLEGEGPPLSESPPPPSGAPTPSGFVPAREHAIGSARISAPPADEVSEWAERFERRSLVGRGGMGVVYRAWDSRLHRWVALKVMHGDLSERPGYVERFIREARTAAMLDHPNIVTIHDVAQVGPDIQIVMAWIDGEDLHRVIQREGAFPLERASLVLSQVASALDYAHHHDPPVLHRDVKPANIMLGPGDRVVLTDFGIAKHLGETSLTSTGQLVGTPDYMAPEVVRGDEPDHRADIYALGVVLYEMVTGRTPFHAETPLAILHAQLNAPPPPPRTFVPGLPEAVERAILIALSKDPAYRFQSAAALARAFQTAVH